MIERGDCDSSGVRFDEIDVVNEAQIAATMQMIAGQFGSIDVMVNNHAHFVMKTNEETTGEEWDRILAVNIKVRGRRFEAM